MSEGSITAFQADVARLFFALPEAGSFLLAGGLALVAHGLPDRPTEDLDAFTSKAGDVSKAAGAFVRAAVEKLWTVDMVQESETFVRLSVAGEAALIVDIIPESPPDLPPTMSILGPTFAPKELAARKSLALRPGDAARLRRSVPPRPALGSGRVDEYGRDYRYRFRRYGVRDGHAPTRPLPQ